MRKSVWIFLFAVLLPAIALGWLALRSAEEQQIVFERRTAELYQKETETLAAAVRETVESERRGFGDAVHRLLAKGDAAALARDFANTLADAWPRKAVGFVLGEDGRMLSPTNGGSASHAEQRRFLVANSSFLTGTEASQVYFVAPEVLQKGVAYQGRAKTGNVSLSFAGNSQENERVASLADKDASKNQSLGVAATASDMLRADKGEVQAADALEKAKLAGAVPKPATKAASALKLPDPASPPPMPVAAAVAPAGAMREVTTKDAKGAKTAPAPAAARGKEETDFSLARSKTAIDSAVSALEPMLEKAMDAPFEKTKSERKVAAENDANANALINRQVEPQQQAPASPTTNWSTVIPAMADFRVLTQGSEEGMVSRFVEDKLDLIFWLRPPEAPEMVFGCLVEAAELRALWPAIFAEQAPAESGGSRPPFILALLDDKAHPMATQQGGENVRDWKHPFVASEIGEVLPHWEATLTLASPTALADTARGLRRLISFAIFGAVALIALGGWLVVADARRQLALAQQKTDFVSNVSHELKTPLTSIRMFAELMHDRPQPAEKQGQYLRIITVEAERLTRLINNVLDFAKSERKQRHFEKKPFDLHETISRIWEGQEIHLGGAGFSTRWEAAPALYPLLGDEDAIAQVLVNLLSNAEKYSTERKEIELHTWLEKDAVCVSVLDRGMGVPPGEERKIFEAFYRAHDSLSSGIQGSGLGLTLAQRVATEHGGTLVFERREGGGSRFVLRLPLILK